MTDLPHRAEPASWPETTPIVAARVDIARKLAIFASALALGLFFVERLTGAPLDADSFLSLLLAAMGVVAWALLKTRHYASVVWFLVVGLFVMAVASTFFYGSVRTVDNALILVGQIAVGIFYSRRALVWTTVGSIGLLGVLTWADASGLLLGTPNFDVSLRTFLPVAACLVGVALMMYLNRTQMRAAQDLHVLEARQRLQTQLDRDLGQGRFRRVFRSSPTPIFVQSAQTGEILDVNPAFERALGYQRKDVLNKRDRFLWVHDQQHGEFARNRRTALRTEWHPVTAICCDGQHLSLLICRERDEDPADKLVITIMQVVGKPELALPPLQPQPGPDASSFWQSTEGESHA